MERELGLAVGRLRRRGETMRPERGLSPAAWVERLEGRMLLAAAITAFPIPSSGSIGPLTLGADGNLWYGRVNWSGGILNLPLSGRVGRVTPSGVVAELPLPSGGYPASRLTAAPDGNLWFTEIRADNAGTPSGSFVARVTPAGAISEFPLPADVSPSSDLTVGPDGNLWFMETIRSEGRLSSTGRVARVTLSGVVTEFPLPAGRTGGNLTAGPDGNLWFSGTINDPSGSSRSGFVGRVTPSGVVSEYAPPSTGYYSELTVGTDGNLWFTEAVFGATRTQRSGVIARLTPSGVFTEFPIPSSGTAGTLTVGSDGNLWFLASVYDSSFSLTEALVGRVTPSGAITEFPLAAGHFPQSELTLGPEGDLWFVGSVTSNDPATPNLFVTRVSNAGAVSESLLGEATPVIPGSGFSFVNPSPLTVGSDGNLWLTETLNRRGSPTASLPDAGKAIDRVNVVDFPVPQPLSPMVQGLARAGVHARPTRLVISFDAALASNSAQNPRNYNLVLSGPRGRVRPHARPVPIRRATYDPGSHSVTLTLGSRLPIQRYFRVTVRGTLAGANGALLDGTGRGQPGTDYSALLHKFGPVTPSAAGRLTVSRQVRH